MADDSHVLATRGQAQRGAHAVTLFVARLRADARVQAEYRRWRDAHGLTGALVGVTARALAQDKDRDLARLRLFVRDELHVSSLSWLPLALLVDFAAMVLTEVTRGATPLAFALEAPPNLDIPRGVAPKTGGDYLARDIDWYYRAKVQRPPDTTYAIAKQHRERQAAAGINHGGLNHSKVQNAIARTEALLRCFEAGQTI